MNRKILLSTIFIASFFLVFLGMRTPNLSGPGAPKQQPRAIIENVTSKPLDAGNYSVDDFACVVPVFKASPSQRAVIFKDIPVLVAHSFTHPALTIARAPPAPSA
ncbi:MAG: hypothetical protein FIA91_08805 [Geobacter sp.]|nr:hypothetical protein [Geobacter sp.]